MYHQQLTTITVYSKSLTVNRQTVQHSLLFYQLISQIKFCAAPHRMYLLFKFIYRIIWDCSIYLSGVFNKGRVDFVRTKFWEILDKHYISEALRIT
jgi:hypothetical protein